MPRRSEADAPAGSGALRNLVGAGPSQVGVVGALRARDVSRPTDADMRAALAKPAPSMRPVAPSAGSPTASAQHHDRPGKTPVSS